ncbi:MAG TPA: M23 family metallopeptidase [Desulfomonilaceae bacterium]|nr:M23 family metallopeptidase [Desulfomonilaceae bacterium]
MLSDRRQIKMAVGPGLGHALRTIAVSILAVGTIAVGLYLYLVPGASANIPFSGSADPASLTGDNNTCAVGAPDEALNGKDSQVQAGSQEMVDLTGEGDTLYLLLNANLLDETESRKIADRLAAAIQKSLSKPNKPFVFDANTPLNSGGSYSVVVDENGNFLKASFEYDPANVFHAVKEGNNIRCRKEEVVLDFKTESISFRMTGTLDQSLKRIGEGQKLAAMLHHVFKYDIDFERESMRGDTCKVLFQRKYADDRPSGYGDILAAVYDGKKTGRKEAIFFDYKLKDQLEDQPHPYYDSKGIELEKSLLRSPLSVMRVTSGFQRNRFHPIYQIFRHHMGTDYGAPKGTPARAVAKGVVTFAGWKNGYGKFVCIKHEDGYESRYGHLHKIEIEKSKPVKQGQIVGLVGQTGDATGPHLHFELLQRGKYLNPVSKHQEMARTPRSIPEGLRTRFNFVKDQRLTALGGGVLIRTADRESTIATR